jgi:hypothetical protein
LPMIWRRLEPDSEQQVKVRPLVLRSVHFPMLWSLSLLLVRLHPPLTAKE